MSFHYCTKCWETSCECGYKYKHWSPELMLKVASILIRMAFIKSIFPQKKKVVVPNPSPGNFRTLAEQMKLEGRLK